MNRDLFPRNLVIDDAFNNRQIIDFNYAREMFGRASIGMPIVSS